MFLDEWRFDTSIISWATQCVLYDGSPVPITRPQNVPGNTGHVLYRGSAPVFVTGKLSDAQRLDEAAAVNAVTGQPRDAEASMIRRRLKVYQFRTRIPNPEPKVPYCGRCFAELVCQYGALPVHPSP